MFGIEQWHAHHSGARACCESKLRTGGAFALQYEADLNMRGLCQNTAFYPYTSMDLSRRAGPAPRMVCHAGLGRTCFSQQDVIEAADAALREMASCDLTFHRQEGDMSPRLLFVNISHGVPATA